MAYKYYNPNPSSLRVGDCIVRAISIFLNQTWNETYVDVCRKGYALKDMPSSNNVWMSYLEENGCSKNIIRSTCKNCYSVKNFCTDYPTGIYLLCTGTHAVTVVNGNYYDTWDSGDEIPILYFVKEESNGL